MPKININPALDVMKIALQTPKISINPALDVMKIVSQMQKININPALDVMKIVSQMQKININPALDVMKIVSQMPKININPALDVMKIALQTPKISINPALDVIKIVSQMPKININPLYNAMKIVSQMPETNINPAYDVIKATIEETSINIKTIINDGFGSIIQKEENQNNYKDNEDSNDINTLALNDYNSIITFIVSIFLIIFWINKYTNLNLADQAKNIENSIEKNYKNFNKFADDHTFVFDAIKKVIEITIMKEAGDYFSKFIRKKFGKKLDKKQRKITTKKYRYEIRAEISKDIKNTEVKKIFFNKHRFVNKIDTEVKKYTSLSSVTIHKLQFGHSVHIICKNNHWSFVEFWVDENTIKRGWVITNCLSRFD